MNQREWWPAAVRRAVLAGLAALVAPALVPSGARAAEPAAVDFSRDIQPLLARRCYACHGPDTQEAGLRLDESAAATAALDSGARAIVPGDPATSAILARVTSTDPDLRMPPEGTALTAAQVDALRGWIAAGAPWQEHWAFRPLVRPAVPELAGVDHPIDAFIRAGLERRALPVPPEADRLALVRRVSFGLTGLPPSEVERERFLADTSPGAWERLVDRLLASPHHGEHLARRWLDLVRYADTNSFERDGPKPHSWRYRDYVIRAFNDDKPFDRFTLEQLAGDEQPTPSPDDLVATGYYRLGLWDDEPADRLQARYDWLDDIVATTGQVWLGLSINCARCHDHKIDPLPQRDYYALLAFFHNVTPMANGGDQIERAIFADEAARRDHQTRVADLERRRGAAQAAVTALETRFRERLAEAGGGPEGGDIDDLAFRFYRDTWDKLPDFDALKPEDRGTLPAGLFDIAAAPSLRPDHFGYVFTGFLKVPADGDYTFSLDSDDGARLSLGGATVIDHDGIHGEGEPRVANVTLAAGRVPLRLDYFQGAHGKGLSVSWSGPGFVGRRLSALPRSGRGKKKESELAAAIKADGERLLGADWKRDYDAAVAALEVLKKEQVPVEKALVVSEHGREAPPTHVFFRGNPHVPRDAVEPGVPSILRTQAPEIVPLPDGIPSTGRRTALAKWLVSPDNPLTARVLVNRIWQHHFGRGLVRSSSNFGMLGDPPTHPELLDWLASELVAGGWKLKRIHRLIVTSAAYRASSRADTAALAADPLNDALWRFDMRRLGAEELRDAIHVASGQFNPTMFGPGVYPEIPAEVLATQSRPGSGWGDSPPEEEARRSVYVHVKRSLLTPILADFDVADTDTSCPVRFVTTQPTQSLGMMNGAFLHRQARAFAERVKREAGGPDGALERAMVGRAIELAFTRPASAAEIDRGVALVDALEDHDGVGPGRALELYCLLLLNANEFCYLD
ncbi:MAG: DUF1553 domain-containing protein [Planctomycetes bacterium]|nr:DUF1553 domain-containing protein [Planctomycetota bacterium]